MAALEFPPTPSDGDTYAGYVFNAAKNVWQWVTTSIDASNPQYGDILAYDPTGKRFTNAIDVNGVMVFDDSAARGSAIPSPTEGMVTYRKDLGGAAGLEVFDGSTFGPVSGILQVVQTGKTDTFSTTSTSLTNITGLSVSITPSSTASKILVLLQIGAIDNNTAAQPMIGDVVRNTTPIGVGDAAGSRTRGGWTVVNAGDTRALTASWSWLDSPATTSAVTYQARVRTSGGTLFINRTSFDNDAATFGRTVSTITAIEVAG